MRYNRTRAHQSRVDVTLVTRRGYALGVLLGEASGAVLQILLKPIQGLQRQRQLVEPGEQRAYLPVGPRARVVRVKLVEYRLRVERPALAHEVVVVGEGVLHVHARPEVARGRCLELFRVP